MKTNHSKNAIILVLLGVILVAMYLTNPNKQQLRTHITKSIRMEAAESGGLEGALRGAFAGFESILTASEIQHHDFKLFSVFKINGVEGHRFYIGLFGSFIKID